MSFTYADLFAGIGGFHAVLSGMGGVCRFVSEIDEAAAKVYELNWGDEIKPARGRPLIEGDIVPLTDEVMLVPKVDVLAAGFPCQPFSKSGHQRGINEARGTLFFNILRILQERTPSVIVLENVRNLAGPRHAETWSTIIRLLRDTGYKVSSAPTVFSPHLLPPELGGTPQVRERVFILGTYVGSAEKAWALSTDEPVVPRAPVNGWDPEKWDLETVHLAVNGAPLLGPDTPEVMERYRLTDPEQEWIDLWDDFVDRMWDVIEDDERLPGFPIWADHFVHIDELVVPDGTPPWKENFLNKNALLYTKHQDVIENWLDDWFGTAVEDRQHWVTKNGFYVPPSRRKLEWQAQKTASLRDCVLHFRPSGIRAKRATYLPALVAITQTSVIAPRNRRLTPREAARLQGLPDDFVFGDQSDSATYRQLGNGVSVGAAHHVLHEHLIADMNLLPRRLRTAFAIDGQPVGGR